MKKEIDRIMQNEEFIALSYLMIYHPAKTNSYFDLELGRRVDHYKT